MDDGTYRRWVQQRLDRIPALRAGDRPSHILAAIDVLESYLRRELATISDDELVSCGCGLCRDAERHGLTGMGSKSSADVAAQ